MATVDSPTGSQQSRTRLSLATRVLIGLVAGAVLGLALAGHQAPAVSSVLAIATAIGGIFVDLIRMTAMPLVVSLVVGGIGAATSDGVGRTGVRATGLAIALLVLATVGSMAAALPALSGVTPDPAALATAARARGAVAAAPSLVQWIRDLVSPNIFKAAADGAMLPVIVAAVLMSLALARVRADRRDAVLTVVDGIADAMQRLVAWILQFAPIGVFALAVPLAARMGLGGAGAMVTYVVVVVALTVVAIALLYPIVAVIGRMSPGAFAGWCAPAQALAFASRSSLATLPAMVQAAERADFPPAASRLVMPLAVSVFHYGSAVAQTVGVLFLARLAGVSLSPASLATIAFTVIVTSSAVPGIPGGTIIAIAPVLTAANLPVEGLGLLLAMDAIPDMFRTTANVTGAMALTAMLRHESAEVPAPQV